MSRSILKIIKAIYFDPSLGPQRGTDVTTEALSEVNNNQLIYNGSYNRIFPDHFKRVRKKLRIELEYKGRKYIKQYDEDEKISLPKDLGFIKKRKININNPWVVGIGLLIIGSLLVSIYKSDVVRDYYEYFFSNPVVRVNLTEVKESQPGITLHDINYLFTSFKGQGTLVAVKNIDFDLLDREFEEIFVTTDFTICDHCVEYNVSIANVGKSMAEDIIIELQGNSKIFPFSNEDIPSAVELTCSDIGKCIINIESLKPGEILRIPLLGGEGGVTFSCAVDGVQEYCYKDYIDAFAYVIPAASWGEIEVDGQFIKLPELNNSDVPQCFHMDTESFRWLSFECGSGHFMRSYSSYEKVGGISKEELIEKLKQMGLDYDLSSIPDNAIINSYRLRK